jgi:tetratricopeptide (TPR) repeat protein
MTAEELLERYEATGDDDTFAQARERYEALLAQGPDAAALRDYGYLLECRARFALRAAVERYERAMELDPADDQVRYQHVSAKAALRELDEVVARYERELAAAPGEVRWHRLLASAHLLGGAHEQAASVIDAGLQLVPGDRPLLERRGEVRAARGDVEGALADWRASLDPDGHDIGGAYSSAFLLEREGRLDEAIVAWRYILDFNESRGYELQAQWPRQEIARLEATAASARG